MVMQSGLRSDLSEQFFCLWFYFLDVKLILFIIDNFGEASEMCAAKWGG